MKRGMLLMAGAIVLLALFLGRLEAGYEDQGKLRLEEALRRTALTGYVCDGYYPVSVADMEQRYGLQYDKSRFVVRYELAASNFMPQITVLEVGP